MTLRYKLPDGTEVPPAAIGGAKPNTHIWVEHPTLGSISIDSALVDEVEPPLPPVPDAPAVMVGDHVFMRDDILVHLVLEPMFICPGYCHKESLNWAELNGYAAAQGKPIIPLVPDPAADAPELPFKLWHSGERSAIVEPSDAYAGRLFVEVDSAHLVRKDVRQLAAALWAWAAREVERP